LARATGSNLIAPRRNNIATFVGRGAPAKSKTYWAFFAHRFCPWEIVGNLAQGAALPVLAIHKKSSAVDKGVTGIYARASGSPAFVLAQIVDKICSAGNRRP
jgi:hypothetical protein